MLDLMFFVGFFGGSIGSLCLVVKYGVGYKIVDLFDKARKKFSFTF